MISSQKIGNEIYQNLGKLFYALAMADKKIHPKEVEKLKAYVRNYWLPVDEVEDEFGTDAAYQIEIIFDWLAQEEMESNRCFDDFLEFYHDHPHKFSPKIKQLTWQTADGIAASFSGKNKSELILLAKLKKALKMY
ncbi:MAG: hypothetical protein MUO53_17795 [Maribacter sp.]|nr:hypothetical protein [Maribacter sp.]